jgi:hypothetical protein
VTAPTDERAGLYRLYDEHDFLLYVGVSLSTFRRLSEHAQGKGWWQQVRKITLEPQSSRAGALAAEARAILEECPLYNIAGQPLGFAPDEELPLAAPVLDLTGLAPTDLGQVASRAAAGYERLGYFILPAYLVMSCIAAYVNGGSRQAARDWIAGAVLVDEVVMGIAAALAVAMLIWVLTKWRAARNASFVEAVAP